jgi:BolA protein
VSPAFTGKSRLQRHRMVNEVLAEELSGKIHALAVTALTPEDAAKRPA